MHRQKRILCAFLAVQILFALFSVVQSSGQSTGLSATVSASLSEDERAIRVAAAEWSKAAFNKDLDKTVSYYAEDAHMYPFNAPRTETKADIRRVWTAFITAPGAVLDTKTTNVVVAKSGDLAYETGTFVLTQNDPSGQPSKTPGKYVVVWLKQANHEWKAIADIFNTDK
jgi:uncharacterized protein (TIGR02246 family)